MRKVEWTKMEFQSLARKHLDVGLFWATQQGNGPLAQAFSVQ
jgi:hypothetical protein